MGELRSPDESIEHEHDLDRPCHDCGEKPADVMIEWPYSKKRIWVCAQCDALRMEEEEDTAS